ncbi:amidase [Nannocystaceae bacterium ST9]
MTSRDPLLMSAFELAAAIRAGETSSREVVGAHVEHARRVNPAINAIVVDRYSQALHEAELADARIAATPAAERERLPALWGVPCTVKESFAFEGMPNTAGLVARQGQIAGEDATCVARLKQAGAICIGLTNVSELCMWMESSNRVYGRSNNPYDPRCIVGGSSGGEGAIVGAGASPWGLGADIGGSIRMPAFFCGVFGHKPTGGLVPGTGMHPLAENEALRYLATGPIARRAGDLMPLLRLLAGPDGRDGGCLELEIGELDEVDPRALEVTLVESNGKIPVDDEMLEALERAGEVLERAGARVTRRAMPEFGRAYAWWSAMLSDASEVSFKQLLGEGQAIPVGRELLRWIVGRSPHTLPALALAAMEDVWPFVPSEQQLRTVIAEGLAFRARLHEQLGRRGLILYPSHPRPAPRHHAPLLRPFDWSYTAIFNVMELPVTQVPMGLGRAGVPLGVQVVAGHACDHVSIAVANLLERETGGWVLPYSRDDRRLLREAS